MDKDCRVQIELSSPVAILYVEGDVSAFSEEALESAADQVINQGIHQLIFVFEKVDYMNSAGLSILIGIVTRVKDQGGRVAAVGLTPHYQKIFQMIGLAKFVDVCSTKNEVFQNWGVSQQV